MVLRKIPQSGQYNKPDSCVYLDLHFLQYRIVSDLVSELRARAHDPLMKYLYRLRNDVLKEGKTPVSSRVYVEFLNTDWVNQLPKPPNTKRFFIGDKLGGSGFEIKLPDGSIEKLYIKLPWDTVITSTHFEDMPNSHLGKTINGMSIKEVCDLYLQYLKMIIEKAKEKFIEK